MHVLCIPHIFHAWCTYNYVFLYCIHAPCMIHVSCMHETCYNNFGCFSFMNHACCMQWHTWHACFMHGSCMKHGDLTGCQLLVYFMQESCRSCAWITRTCTANIHDAIEGIFKQREHAVSCKLVYTLLLAIYQSTWFGNCCTQVPT